MTRFKDSFQVVRHSVYRIKVGLQHPDFEKLITQKVDLISRAFFESVKSGDLSPHAEVFVVMREMIFPYLLAELRKPSPEKLDIILQTYRKVVDNAYATFLGMLEASFFPRIAGSIPRLLEDFGSMTQFVAHADNRVAHELVEKHKCNAFLVVFKLMQLRTILDLSAETRRSIRDFLETHGYPRIYLDLPFFSFDKTYTGGEVHTLDEDFFNYLALSAFILRDTEISRILPESDSLDRRQFHLERFRDAIASMSRAGVMPFEGQDTMPFQEWQTQCMHNVEKALNEMPELKRKELAATPISKQREEHILDAVVDELAKWPQEGHVTSKQKVVLKTRLGLPKELLIDSIEDGIDLATPQVAKMISQGLLGRLVASQTPTDVRVAGSYPRGEEGRFYIAFLPRDQYVTYKREVSRNMRFVPSDSFFDDRFVGEAYALGIKIIDSANHTRLWVLTSDSLPVGFEPEFCKMDRISAGDDKAVYEFSVAADLNLPIEVYELELSDQSPNEQ